ncbi:hypothetical protein [Aeromonas hydrophila]|uniref:ArnT family glycosyltransferase n=2 Tax=Aeromonas TaxID=642 RepID=UPI0030D46FF7
MPRPEISGRKLGWMLLLVTLVLLFGQFDHQLWTPDEPREAAIAIEMYRSGDWVAPTLGGRSFIEKPPLFYIVAISFLGGWHATLHRSAGLSSAWLATGGEGRSAEGEPLSAAGTDCSSLGQGSTADAGCRRAVPLIYLFPLQEHRMSQYVRFLMVLVCLLKIPISLAVVLKSMAISADRDSDAVALISWGRMISMG